jgi:hypothetical protein
MSIHFCGVFLFFDKIVERHLRAMDIGLPGKISAHGLFQPVAFVDAGVMTVLGHKVEVSA